MLSLVLLLQAESHSHPTVHQHPHPELQLQLGGRQPVQAEGPPGCPTRRDRPRAALCGLHPVLQAVGGRALRELEGSGGWRGMGGMVTEPKGGIWPARVNETGTNMGMDGGGGRVRTIHGTGFEWVRREG